MTYVGRIIGRQQPKARTMRVPAARGAVTAQRVSHHIVNAEEESVAKRFDSD